MIMKLALVMLAVWTASLLSAQDYCSLTVRILSPDGRRPAVAVSVVENDGRVENHDQDSGDVHFCDLGGRPVTVKIGDDGTCNQVIIREVPVSWNRPYLLRVTYDPEPCLRESPRSPVPTCRVVFRVSDFSGKWIQGAAISLLRPKSTTLRSDRFGRASFVVKLGDDVQGSADTEGQSVDFRFTCTLDELVRDQQIKFGKR